MPWTMIIIHGETYVSMTSAYYHIQHVADADNRVGHIRSAEGDRVIFCHHSYTHKGE